jgi:hypothetical protein
MLTHPEVYCLRTNETHWDIVLYHHFLADVKPGIAPWADDRPENAPIPDRGPVCLTAHEHSSTVPLEDLIR